MKKVLLLIVAISCLISLSIAACPSIPVATTSSTNSPATTTSNSDTTPTTTIPGWKLVWSDEFSGTSLNLSKWAYEIDCAGGGNNQLQCYTNREKNVRVSNGTLIISAIQETYTGTSTGCTSKYGASTCLGTRQYTSGRIRGKYSKDSSFLQGKFEIRAKLPNGKHLWPAIWMLSTDGKIRKDLYFHNEIPQVVG
jgi:beta-glucanase (GH16 family)